MRGCSWGPIRPLRAPGSRKPEIILRDKALSPGGLQLGAELDGLLPRAIRPDHRSILGLPVGQIHPLDHRRTRPEYGVVLARRQADRLLAAGWAVVGRPA